MTADEQRAAGTAGVRTGVPGAKSSEEAVRKLMESEPRFDPAVWAQAADQLRLPGLAIPEEYGGDGFGLVELGVVMEEMGRALFCSPFFATVGPGGPGPAGLGRRARPARAISPASRPDGPRPTLAVAEDDGSWDPAMVSARAVPDGDGGWTVRGRKSFVIDGTTADLILVVARTVAGPSLFAVDRDAPGLTAEPMETLDATRAMARLTFDAVPATLVGAEGRGGRIMAKVLDIASVGLAAEQAGGARRCLETSTDYARVRHQFGRPIGSFQAVKHKCADMLVQVELAEAASREAARLADEDAPDFPVAAAVAHACCSRAYMFAATENIQVHGGIGFTWEHPAHLYFRRAKSSAAAVRRPGGVPRASAGPAGHLRAGQDARHRGWRAPPGAVGAVAPLDCQRQVQTRLGAAARKQVHDMDRGDPPEKSRTGSVMVAMQAGPVGAARATPRPDPAHPPGPNRRRPRPMQKPSVTLPGSWPRTRRRRQTPPLRGLPVAPGCRGCRGPVPGRPRRGRQARRSTRAATLADRQRRRRQDGFRHRFPEIDLTLIVDYSKYHDVRVDNQFATDTLVPDVVQLQTLQDFTRWKQQGRLLHYKPAGFSQALQEVQGPGRRLGGRRGHRLQLHVRRRRRPAPTRR